MTLNELFKGAKSKFFWCNILAMICVVVALITITMYALDIYTHHGESVSVPSITGVNQYQAAKMLEDAGLEYEVVDSTYRKDMTPDCVVEQSPAAGTQVKKGHIIYLTINSTHSPNVTMPDIADNTSLREAQAKLSAIGIKVGPIELTNGEKDWVYGVKYNGRNVFAGDRIPSQAVVILVVGNGNNQAADTINDHVNTTSDVSLDEISE